MTDDKALTEEEKKNRKKAERERKRQEARENAEKKKRFGLTPDKKRKLKLLIMKKATEDLKNEAEKKIAAKKAYLDQRVKPLPEMGSLNEAQLVSICKDLHKQIADQEEAKYDFEMKIRKQDYEINELTIKVNDIKGKFIKPTLKKVNKTQSKFAKLEKLEPTGADFRANLKSSGKDKFALEDISKEDDKVNFRDQLKSAKEREEE
jgi:troponin I, cardiac muscle